MYSSVFVMKVSDQFIVNCSFVEIDFCCTVNRDVGYEEKRLSLIRRIDFAWAIEKDDDKKKQKKTSKESATPWQWQSMIENLQLAHQELSVIIDLINTVSFYIKRL